MPRSRTYTEDGYLEIQWSLGGLICIVSGNVTPNGDTEQMHQFIPEDSGQLRSFAKSLRRAMKQAHSKEVKETNRKLKAHLISENSSERV